MIARLAQFLESRELTCRASTIKLYKHNLEKFEEWLGSNPLDAEHISSYLRQCKARNLAQDTVRTQYRQIKTYCNWLVEFELLAKNPFYGRGRVLPPPLKRRRRKTYSEADIVKLLNAPAAQAKNKRNLDNKRQRWQSDGPQAREDQQARALVVLLVDSGMRAGEVASLTCGQVRADELVISGKGGHEDVAFISVVTRKVLLELAGQRPDSDPLFLDWHGQATEARELRNIIKRLAKRAGVELPARPLHAFRHYAARQWVKAKLNDLTIQQIMRHSQLATTQIYTGLDERELSELHEAASPIAKLLTRASAG